MWTYESSTGKMYDPNRLLVSNADYSGHGEGVNNPALQNVHQVGPIPEGWYTRKPAVDSPEHGPQAIELIPDTNNEMFGRSGFWEHGDEVLHPGQHLASLGCIIEPRFQRDREEESADKRLYVVATVSEETFIVADPELGM